MKKTVFKPAVTTILHIAAGQQLDVLVSEEGKVFIEYPMPDIAGVVPSAGKLADAVSDTTKSKVEEVAEKARTKKVEANEVRKVSEGKKKETTTYTEDELMKMDVKELTEILDEMGVAIPKEGKNTNKKLRLLVLEAQEGSDDEEEEEEETPAPKKSTAKTKKEEVAEEEEDEDDDAKVLTDIFTRLDEEEIDEKQAVKELVKFGYEKEDATEIVDEFIDGEEEIEDFVEVLLEDSEEEDEVEEEEAPAPKKSSKKSEKENVVEIADLKAGDKVSVYFESEEDFVKGEVKSAKRGKVIVTFEDDTEEILDAEENTKILLLS